MKTLTDPIYWLIVLLFGMIAFLLLTVLELERKVDRIDNRLFDMQWDSKHKKEEGKKE